MRRSILIILCAFLLVFPCSCDAEKEENPLCFFGSDIQESSVLMSRAAFPDGCDNAVIAQADGSIALWSGTAFAGAIDAPILIVKNKSEIDRELERLSAKNVYIFGNFKYNPPKSVSCVRFSSKETVSEDAAEYLQSTLNINYDSAFLVFSPNDAAAVAAQAYKLKAPIFLVSRTGPVSDKTLALTSQSHNYIVGKGAETDVILKFGENCERIYGHCIEELSGFANMMFDGDTQSLTAVNSTADAAISAAFATKNNSAVIYFKDRLYPSQEKFLSERNTDAVYSVSTLIKTNFAPALKAETAKIPDKIFTFDTKFKKAVFYVPHQDDETLLQSQAILGAIDAYGADNVTVILFTDGASSRMKHNGSTGETLDSIMNAVNEKLGKPLNSDDAETLRTALFSRARDNEFYSSLGHFGVKRENIRSIGLVDGQVKDSLDRVKAVMAEYKDDPELIHVTFSPYYETHVDHASLGRAMLETLGENAANAYFIARYDEGGLDKFYAEKDFYNAHMTELFARPDLNKLSLASSEYGKESCDVEAISTELADGINSGKAPADAAKSSKSVGNLRMAVGYNSVTDFFLISSARVNHGAVITVMHRPFIN